MDGTIVVDEVELLEAFDVVVAAGLATMPSKAVANTTAPSLGCSISVNVTNFVVS